QRERFLSGRGVPALDDKQVPPLIPTAGGDPLAVGVPGHAPDDTLVAGELDAHPAGPHIPDLHGRILAARGSGARRSNSLAVGADGHDIDFTSVFAEGEGLLTFVPRQRRGVPEPDGRILAARREAPAVGAERHALGPVDVPTEDERLLAGRRLPDAHRLISAGRGEAQAIGAEG